MTMKRFVSYLLMFVPLLSFAQVDDIYFVPKKETRVLVVRSTEEAYFADADELESASVESYDDYDSASENYFYTNDIESVYDDYEYSNRIIRFHSPKRLLSSSLYLDLNYGYGVNDWMVYDNGYSIEIYPTEINPLYWVGYPYWNRYNISYYNRYWSWNSYWSWPWYGHHYDYCWDNHWHHHHWAGTGGHNNFRPYRPGFVRDLPTNGSVGNRPGRGGSMPVVNGNTRPQGGFAADGRDSNTNGRGDALRRQPSNSQTTVQINGNNGNVRTEGRDNGIRRQPDDSRNSVVQVNNGNSESRSTGRDSGIRRQPNGNSNSAVRVNNGNNETRSNGRDSGIRRQQQPRRENNSGSVRQSRDTSRQSESSRSNYGSGSSGSAVPHRCR